MSDDPFESDEWKEWVEHVRQDSVRKISESAVMISIVPNAEDLDIKYAVELGAAIMMDKPIVILVSPGRTVPERLRRVADEVVEADIDLEEGQEKLHAALKRLGLT